MGLFMVVLLQSYKWISVWGDYMSTVLIMAVFGLSLAQYSHLLNGKGKIKLTGKSSSNILISNGCSGSLLATVAISIPSMSGYHHFDWGLDRCQKLKLCL